MSPRIVIETPRLILRHFTLKDADNLAVIYADPITMKFLRRTRTYPETLDNLNLIFESYKQYGFGLWAVIHKNDNKLIGRCGLIAQKIEGISEVEIAYMIARKYWRQGIGTEAASAIRDYGFQSLGYQRLISLIDIDNIASQKTALKTGMSYEREIIFDDKPILVYAIHS